MHEVRESLGTTVGGGMDSEMCEDIIWYSHIGSAGGASGSWTGADSAGEQFQELYKEDAET